MAGYSSRVSLGNKKIQSTIQWDRSAAKPVVRTYLQDVSGQISLNTLPSFTCISEYCRIQVQQNLCWQGSLAKFVPDSQHIQTMHNCQYHRNLTAAMSRRFLIPHRERQSTLQTPTSLCNILPLLYKVFSFSAELIPSHLHPFCKPGLVQKVTASKENLKAYLLAYKICTKSKVSIFLQPTK